MNKGALMERIRDICFDMEQLQENVRHINVQIMALAGELDYVYDQLNTSETQIPNVEGAIPCPLCDGRDGGCLYCSGNGWLLKMPDTMEANIREAVEKFCERTGLTSPSMCTNCLGRGYVTNSNEDGVECCIHCDGTGRVEE